MTSRRKWFAALAGLPAVGVIFGRAALAKPRIENRMPGFDARDWAKYFVEYVRRNPSIATDTETMTTWFASAIMRGYDQHASDTRLRVTYPCGCTANTSGAERLPNYCPEHGSIEALRGAVARGWCADANRHKVMDVDLGEAIVQELLKLREG